MTEIPDQVMLDADAHNYLKENEDHLITVVETGIELHLSVIQANEIKAGLDDLPEKKKKGVLDEIYLVENLADPIVTGVETSGFGEVFGHNFGGSTGEIYEELIAPHENIGKVHRPDAIGAEAAINRGLLFVTGDRSLQEKMKECGYHEYLLPLEKFYELISS